MRNRRHSFLFFAVKSLFGPQAHSERCTWSAAAIVAFAMLAGTGAAQAAAPLMSIPGQPAVSADGSFNYSIPIAVPPGTNGMTPNLSLDYSSASTDGFEGWGFSLGGLDSITRCARTLTIDNVHGSVNYDIDDRFCLDGQRLMVVSGTYGADGSIYRTYIDNFTKIIAHGQTYVSGVATGPQWFEVHTRSGTVLQFGNTADSAIQAVGKTTIREWLVNRVTDTKGNYFAVTYVNDQTNGQAYPTEIDYTGNDAAGLSPYNSVQFSYKTRSDIVPAYQAGSLQQTTKLLTDIKTYAGASLVNDYQLTYRDGTSTLHSRLVSVTQCAGSNCLAPTSFTWQGGADMTGVSGTANSTAQNLGLMAGDFNADGLTDAVVLDTSCPTGGVIFSGSNSGTFTRANMTASYTYWLTGPPPSAATRSGPACFVATTTPLIGDLSGNGFADVMLNERYWDTSGEGQWVPFSNPLLNTTTGAINQPGSVDTTIPQMVILGDFNGDGRIDGYSGAGSGGGRQVYLSNGDGTFTTTGPTGLGGDQLIGGDFDGDGCTDILQKGAPNEIYFLCHPAVATANVPNFSSQTVITGDFNGDLNTDVLVLDGSGSSNAVLYLATGTGVDSGHTISGSSSWGDVSKYQIVDGDWNGDGRTDIALISQRSGYPHLIFLSTGTGFIQVATISDSDGVDGGVPADWNNDGATDLWIKSSSDKIYTALFGSSAYAPERIIEVDNGVGAATTVAYDRLNENGSFYTKGSGASYSYQDYDGADYVVSSFAVSNGIGGSYATTYKYGGLRINVTDPPKKNTLPTGFLAFSSITATDSQTGIVTTTNYNTNIPLVGTISSQTVTAGAVTLRSVVNSWNAAGEASGAYILTLTQSALTQNDLDGTALPSVTTAYSYDSYSNPLTITRTVTYASSTATSTTTNTYLNDNTNWILGQVLTSQVHNVVGSSNLTRHFSFAHDSAGFVTQQNIEPGTPSLALETDIGYDAYGNKTSVSQSGTGITTRSSGAHYDSLGQFPVMLADALSHRSYPAFNAKFGGMTSLTDPNQLTGTTAYDSLGRPATVTKPDGNQTVFAYAYCSGVNGGTASCPTNGAYLVTGTPKNASGSQNGPASTAYYDALGRVIASDTQGFDGSNIRISTIYDADLRVHKTSRPYFTSGGTAKQTTYTYDALGRVTKAVFPDTSQTNYSYDGLMSSVTNDKSQTVTTVLNPQGLTASVTDANGKTTAYAYDAFGDLLTVTDPLGNKIVNTFDLRGRKLTSRDPDMGSWSYGYDVLSELTSQTDAKSQTTALTYDLLGRVTSRSEADLTSNWVYDRSAHGIGLAASACTGSGCTAPSNASYFRYQSYDAYSRPAFTVLTVAGADHRYTTTYNSDGRIDTVSYPSGFTAKYLYNAYGYLSQIKDNRSGAVIWTANARDAELHLTQSTFGNGVVENQTFNTNTGLPSSITAGPSNSVANFTYSWDTIGNLLSRTDNIESTTETFCYDALNRLTNYALAASCTGSGTNTVGYDDTGNVTAKTGVGSYSYPASGPSSVRPHAVLSIAGTVNGVTNPVFTYDANGNMTCQSTGANCTGTVGRSTVWTSFNMAAQVTQSGTSFCLTYDSEHNRITQTKTTATCASPGSGAETTVYLNDPASGGMEEMRTLGASIAFQDYILADGGIVAVRSVTASTPPVWGDPANQWGSLTWTAQSAPTLLYVTADHLGSTSVITDAAGSVSERDSYDAWGLRRNPDGTAASSCTAVTSALTRGFTGQEHIDPVCAINFNARLYDPTLGRFMSADSIIPNPMNGQAFNRYSYVNNGPLSAVDPSGHAAWDHIKVITCFDYCSGGTGDISAGAYAASGGLDAPADKGSWTVTNNSNGQSQTYNSWDAVLNALAEIWNANAEADQRTDIQFDTANFSGTLTLGVQSIEVSDGTLGVASTYGPGLIYADTNGAGQYYLPGLGATYLNPQFADKVGDFILRTQGHGIQLRFTSGYRSPSAQAALRNNPNAITPASQSLHSAGLAVDISVLGMDQATLSTVLSDADSSGLYWGGNFSTPDPVHFQAGPPSDYPVADRPQLIQSFTLSVQALQNQIPDD